MQKQKTTTHKAGEAFTSNQGGTESRSGFNQTTVGVRAPLVEALEALSQNPAMQFHIPGHTRGNGTLKKFKKLIGNKALILDTTDEFDNLGTLHPRSGPIAEAQELAALAFGAKKTFFLINGSTVGNIALAMSVTNKTQKIIVNRNAHRSVHAGLIVSGAQPIWVMPQKIEDKSLWGAVSADDIERLIAQNDDVSMVWITNPTYEGIVSDVRSISAVCKKYGVPLIVDEAHGCLWNFSDELPESSLKLGADAVIHSLHKTGGSMSQSSMLHIAHDSLLDTRKIEQALMLLQSTSPSILLLSSLDAARAHLQSERGQRKLSKTIENAKYIREQLSQINGVELISPCEEYNVDITKIFVKIAGLSGKRLEYILEMDFNIEVEAASDDGVLILCNLGNTKKEAQYLVKSIKTIVQNKYSDIYHYEHRKHMPMMEPQIVMNLRDAFYSEKERVSKTDAVGRISAEVIAECPPGISVLLPGELITAEHLPYLKSFETIEVIKK